MKHEEANRLGFGRDYGPEFVRLRGKRARQYGIQQG